MKMNNEIPKAFRVSVIIPIYNEADTTQELLKRVREAPFNKEIIVVDDCSTDGTTELIRGYAGQGVGTIRHEKRSGVGAAIRTAIEYGRRNGYDILVIMAGNDKDDETSASG